MMASVTHLLVKPAHKQPLAYIDTMTVDETGIAGNVVCGPLRQVLILERRTLDMFNLQPGDLRENIIIDGLDLYALPSGTVLQIGEAFIALTFHCEPCKIIADKVNLKDIRDDRGYLGRVLKPGTLSAGDGVFVTTQKTESIPDKPVERIKWFLAKCDRPVLAADLMWEVGLASSYCRALPAMMRKHPEIDKGKISFKNSTLRGVIY